MFGNQNQVRLPGNTRPKREVSGVPSHHFDDLHPTVRSRRRARTFDHFRDISECGVEAERVVSAGEIFVDGFRHADDRHSSLRKDCGNSERVFTTANDERIQLQSLDIFIYFVLNDPVLHLLHSPA